MTEECKKAVAEEEKECACCKACACEEKTEPQALHAEIEGCVAACPLCGSDLSYQDHYCVCKNENCDFRCDKCKDPDEP